MTVPTRSSLLAELDSLSCGQRTARVALLGRDTKAAPALSKLVSELLDSGEVYQGRLALDLACASRDEAALLRGLSHPSHGVRSCAAALCARYVEDEAALEQALPTLAFDVRRKFLVEVARARRGTLAARLIPLIHGRHGAAEAAKLLSAVDAETARRLLPSLGHAVRGWRALVRAHPDPCLAFIHETIARSPARERAGLFGAYRTPLAELTLERSEQVLALVDQLAPRDLLPGCVHDTLPRLTRRHPERIFALFTHPDLRDALRANGLPPGLLSEAHRFSPEQRRVLARALADSHQHLAAFLEALPPSARPALYAHAFAEAKPRLVPPGLVTVLPRAARDAEAARQLEQREVREQPERELMFWALRDLEVARAPLKKAAFASAPDDRARALVLLVQCTGLSRKGLAETLEDLGRLKNEQDPVRLPVLMELSKLPLSMLTPERIPALEALVGWVVEARDTSYGTRQALQRLAFRLLAFHAPKPDAPQFRFALDTLERLAGQSGALELPVLWPKLPRGTEHHLVATLLPRLRSASEREDFRLVLALARSLGHRAWGVDMLQAMLDPATGARPDVLAVFAIELWLEAPRTRDARVRKLLAQDESAVAIPVVFEHLHRRRQDLLDPYLEGRALSGRFASENTGWVPPVTEGFHRWLPRQQRRLGALLWQIAGDPERGAWERMRVLRILSRFEVTTRETFEPLLDSEDVALVESALVGLSRVDRPEEGLPLLLDQLGTDRARVATDAVRQVGRTLPPERLARLLDESLAREDLKITSRKLLLRMVGLFRPEKGLALLFREWAPPKLHRDVRIAVGQAARNLLDEARAWTLLTELSTSADPYVAGSLLDQHPRQLPESARGRYGALLLALVRHPDLTVRRRVAGTLVRWSVGAEDAVAKAMAGRLLDLEQGADWREALQTLVFVSQDGPGFDEVIACAKRLVSADLAEAGDPSPARDIPERQRLKTLLEQVLDLDWPVRRSAGKRLDALADVLSSEPSLIPERAALRLASLAWVEPEPATKRLREVVTESSAEPLFAFALASAVAKAVERSARAPEALLRISDEMTETAPLVALELVRAAGERLSWRTDAASRLHALRKHPSPTVRAAALDTLTARE